MPLPMSLRIGEPPINIVVDAALALSPMGLVTTMALTQGARVWLPRRMLTLLDNDRLYRATPTHMGGAWLPETDREARLGMMADELPTWQRAWHYGRLSARVFFLGDAHYESVLADRQDRTLLPRFEHCAAALDARLALEGSVPVAPLEECARDAVALVVALQPEPAYILTLGDPPGVPALCDTLERLGFVVRCGPPAMGGLSIDLLDRALAPFATAGGEAALVHVAAPGALALPDAFDEGEWSLDEQDGADGEVWRHACALWQRVAAGAAP